MIKGVNTSRLSLTSSDAGVRRQHSICDPPQQLGVAERMNRTLDEGITTLLSQFELCNNGSSVALITLRRAADGASSTLLRELGTCSYDRF